MMEEGNWKCAICGDELHTGVVFCCIKEPQMGIVIGKCCQDKLRRRIMDPSPIFEEVFHKKVFGKKEKKVDLPPWTSPPSSELVN